jgi:hypothetical protein
MNGPGYRFDRPILSVGPPRGTSGGGSTDNTDTNTDEWPFESMP